jgi:hypothetical protein
MSNVARLRLEEAMKPDMYLGPAEVLRVSPAELEVALQNGRRASARIALGYSYEPRVGDELLVIGGADGHWVIGVLRGTGPSVVHFPADAELRAEGKLRIEARRGVEISSPEVSVTSSKIKMVASEVVHAFTNLRQRVSELLSVQAGQSHTVVAGSMHSQSKSASILTEEKISLNGKEVHLG